MTPTPAPIPLISRFLALYGKAPTVVASAPGRLEVLGNHTDYNQGLTLSCAVDVRCHAALCLWDEPVVRLASTAIDAPPDTFAIEAPLESTSPSHWTNYILGLVAALHARGYTVPGFTMLVDSDVPTSAGLSSSAALEMATLMGLVRLMRIDLPPIELARIGQWAESRVVGANTGLLDQLTSLCGKRDHLLHTDFRSLDYRLIPIPADYAFVAIDSGIKHDLTTEYNDRRRSCEDAAAAMNLTTLRDATHDQLESNRGAMSDQAYRCAKHILGENQRVEQATAALNRGDVPALGQLMFASHDSSKNNFANSCPELDELVKRASKDNRCLGARLCGGGFGGITLHLVRQADAHDYRADIVRNAAPLAKATRWSAVCKISDGATVELASH